MATALAPVEINYVTGLPKERFITEIERPSHYSSVGKERLALHFDRAVLVDTDGAEGGVRHYYAVPHGWVEIGHSGKALRGLSGYGMSDEHECKVRNALWQAGVRADWVGACGPVVVLSVYESNGY